MSFLVDPTSDASPSSTIQAIPSRRGLKRAIDVLDRNLSLRPDESIEQLIDQLNPLDARALADQIRFASETPNYFYQIPTLEFAQISDIEAGNDPVNGGAFGAEIQDVIHAHDRVYLVCSVPEDGAQTQLAFDESARELAIATFMPNSALLTVRAPNAAIADAVRGVVVKELDLEWGSRLSESLLRGPVLDEIVDSIAGLTFRGANQDVATDWIEVSAGSQGDDQGDLQTDPIVNDLLDRHEITLEVAQVQLTVGESVSARISFVDSSIAFQSFVPEATLLELDQALSDVLDM